MSQELNKTDPHAILLEKPEVGKPRATLLYAQALQQKIREFRKTPDWNDSFLSETNEISQIVLSILKSSSY